MDLYKLLGTNRDWLNALRNGQNANKAGGWTKNPIQHHYKVPASSLHLLPPSLRFPFKLRTSECRECHQNHDEDWMHWMLERQTIAVLHEMKWLLVQRGPTTPQLECDSTKSEESGPNTINIPWSKHLPVVLRSEHLFGNCVVSQIQVVGVCCFRRSGLLSNGEHGRAVGLLG